MRGRESLFDGLIFNLQLQASVMSLTVFPSVAMSLISFNIPLVHGCSIKTEITVETYRLFLGLIEKKNLKPCLSGYATLALHVKKIFGTFRTVVIT